MMYRPSSSVVERLRSLFQKRIGDSAFAVLGDGTGRVEVQGKLGYVYIRFPNGKDENGFATYSSPQMARSANAAYLNFEGAGVYVAYRDNNELEVVSAHYAFIDQAGYDTRTLNPLNQQSRFVYPFQLTYGLANAVATSLTDSFLVTVKWFRHYTGGNTFQAFETPLEADKIDLSSYIPATDMHCYAAVWIDTYTNTAEVTTSTPQALSSPLDDTDIQELVTDRPPDAMPLKAFYLANDQATLKQSADESDLRQHMSVPPVLGFPQTLNTRERVRPNRTFVIPGDSSVGSGSLTLESGARLLRVHKTNLTTTDPTTGDDSADGYSVGSYWFNTSSGALFVATGVTVGAAVWASVTSGMESFTVSADSGTPIAIEDDDNLALVGGDAIGTDTDTPGTVTISLLDNGVTTSKILDAAITAIKLATDAVTTAKIAALAVTTAKINDLAVTAAKIADATITLAKLAVGTPGKLIGFDSSGAAAEIDRVVDDVSATWGEAMTLRAYVYRKPSDGKWYKIDTSDPAKISATRGFVCDLGTSGGTINTEGFVRRMGPLTGFSSLTSGAAVYGSTGGGIVQTEPTAVIDAGPVIISDAGYATSTSAVFVDARRPVIYREHVLSSVNEITTITHHGDSLLARKVIARTYAYDAVLADSYSGTRDLSIDLKGPSGAGGSTPIDTLGGTAYRLGDGGGNDFKQAQQFQLTNAGRFDNVQFTLRTSAGSPTDPVTVSIRTDDGSNKPSTTILWTTTVAVTANTTNTATAVDGPNLAASTPYWVVYEVPAQATNVGYNMDGSSSSVYASGISRSDSSASPGTWTTTNAGDLRMTITVNANPAATAVAQQVSLLSDSVITEVRLWLKRTGTLAGNLTLELAANNAGDPGSTITLGTSQPVAASSVSTSYGWVSFLFPIAIRPTMTATAFYHLKLTTSDSVSSTNYVSWGADIGGTYTWGAAKVLVSSTWTALFGSPCALFEIYKQSTRYTERLKERQWSDSGQGQWALRYGDSSGTNEDTITRLMNVSGVDAEIFYDVEVA